MAFDLKDFPMPMGFKKIYRDSLSGELEVIGDSVTRKLFFIDGNLESAMSSAEGEKLGGILQSLGKISKVQKEKVFAQLKGGELLGGHLVKLGFINRQDLFMALQFQIRSIATSAFCATSGSFSFYDGTPQLPPNQQFHIRTPQVIKDGIFQITDFSYYRKNFLDKSPVTTPIPGDLSEILPLEAKRFHHNLSELKHHTNTQVQSRLELDELLYWRRITLLYLLSVVEFLDFKMVDSQIPLQQIEDQDTKVQQPYIPEYKIPDFLESDAKTAQFDEDPDEKTIISQPPIDPFEHHKPVIDEFMAESLQVYDVNQSPENTETEEKPDKPSYGESLQKLHNEPVTDEFKAESLKPYGEDDSEKETEEDSQPPRQAAEPLKDAPQLYLKACQIFRNKKFHETTLIMERLIASDNTKAKYFLLLGLSQSRIPSLIQHAEKNLQRAADLEPWNADPVFYLGELFMAQKMPKRAEKYFKMALEINMEHTLAGNKMKQLDSNKTTFLSSFFSKK